MAAQLRTIGFARVSSPGCLSWLTFCAAGDSGVPRSRLHPAMRAPSAATARNGTSAIRRGEREFAMNSSRGEPVRANGSGDHHVPGGTGARHVILRMVARSKRGQGKKAAALDLRGSRAGAWGRLHEAAVPCNSVRSGYPRPPASRLDSGRVRSRNMATIPRAGPGASTAKAVGHPHRARSHGTSHSVATVSVKPIASCNVSAVPTYPDSAVSRTMVENCAESATPLAPQTSAIMSTTQSGAATRHAIARAHAPETAIASVALVVRPTRSLHAPAHHEPAK